jgi:hypothetical protein
MTPDEAQRHLVEAGVEYGAGALTLEAREGRWFARLPGGRAAWFPADAAGAARLSRDRRVLRLLAAHCGFASPRILHEGEGGWDMRTYLPSAREPFDVFRRLGADSALARRFGRRLGEMLAEQHTRIPDADLAGGWLPERPAWPDPAELPRLSDVVDDPRLLARAGRALERYGALPPTVDPVLLHGDLGLHNIAVGENDLPLGLYDYDGAAFGDRHEDLKYLILHPGGAAMLEGALASYEPLTGVAIDLDRVRLLHAASAIGFLAHRSGHPPDEPWCGRTLAEDLAWTDGALLALGL